VWALTTFNVFALFKKTCSMDDLDVRLGALVELLGGRTRPWPALLRRGKTKYTCVSMHV
jgi:hypothetical protein